MDNLSLSFNKFEFCFYSPHEGWRAIKQRNKLRDILRCIWYLGKSKSNKVFSFLIQNVLLGFSVGIKLTTQFFVCQIGITKDCAKLSLFLTLYLSTRGHVRGELNEDRFVLIGKLQVLIVTHHYYPNTSLNLS